MHSRTWREALEEAVDEKRNASGSLRAVLGPLRLLNFTPNIPLTWGQVFSLALFFSRFLLTSTHWKQRVEGGFLKGAPACGSLCTYSCLQRRARNAKFSLPLASAGTQPPGLHPPAQPTRTEVISPSEDLTERGGGLQGPTQEQQSKVLQEEG